MIRALITAVLIAGAATHYLDVPLDAALGYAFAISVGGWYAWPVLRRPLRYATRFLLRRLRPRRSAGRKDHQGSNDSHRPSALSAPDFFGKVRVALFVLQGIRHLLDILESQGWLHRHGSEHRVVQIVGNSLQKLGHGL